MRKAIGMAVAITCGIALVMATGCQQSSVSAAKPDSTAQKKYSCVAGPNEQCASDLWYADYQKLVAFQKKYAAPQDELDRIAGMVARLNKEIPSGFRWDEQKERFVPLAVTPSPASAPTTSKR